MVIVPYNIDMYLTKYIQDGFLKGIRGFISNKNQKIEKCKMLRLNNTTIFGNHQITRTCGWNICRTAQLELMRKTYNTFFFQIRLYK